MTKGEDIAINPTGHMGNPAKGRSPSKLFRTNRAFIHPTTQKEPL